MGSLSSFLTNKLDFNITYLTMKEQDTINHLQDKLPIGDVSKRFFDVTYQGKDDNGLIVRIITVQAENESDAVEKVRQCGLQLKIYSSNAC